MVIIMPERGGAPNSPDAERSVRSAFATRYPREREQRRIVGAAQLDAWGIAFDAKAINSWADILREARSSSVVSRLIAVVLVLADDAHDLELWVATGDYARTLGVTMGAPTRATMPQRS